MKYAVAVLIALAAVAGAAVIQGIDKSNVSQGYVYPGVRLLARNYMYQPPRPNTIQYQDFTYLGNYTTRISRVTANEVGQTQYATAWIIGGGVGYNTVTIRAQSARGYGFYYLMEIWGQ